jgi:hypothetical protein
LRLIDAVRSRAGNYPRLHGLRTNPTGLTASALCTFRRAADTDSGDKIAVPLLVPTPYVIELIAAKVGRESFKEGIEAIRSLLSIIRAQF